MDTRRFVALGLVALAAPVLAGTDPEWLSLCGKCLNPTVTAKTGAGTERAAAQARVTAEAAQAWCANWQPDDKTCAQQQLNGEQSKVYTASADCRHGKLTAVDGNTYRMAGFWTSDVGRGRTKWKGADGNVVGQDEASGGLELAQQWEVLCPDVNRIGSGQSAAAGGAVGQAQLAQAAPVPDPAQMSQPAPVQAATAPMPDPSAPDPSAASMGSMQSGSSFGSQPVAAGPPPCAAPRCFNAGAFTATVSQLAEGQVGPKRDPAVRVGVTFRNTGTQPLVLAYAAGTSALADNAGSHFIVGAPNTPDNSATGIGKVEGKNADARFVLQPGEARAATFQLLKDKPGRATAAGTTLYNYSVGIAQLDGTGSQVRLVKGFRLGFQGIPPGTDTSRTTAGVTSSASLSDAVKDLESAAKKFGEIFDGKK